MCDTAILKLINRAVVVRFLVLVISFTEGKRKNDSLFHAADEMTFNVFVSKFRTQLLFIA